MINELSKYLERQTGGRMVQRKEKGTLGWRVSTERDHRGLTQGDVVEALRRHGIKTTVVGISEIELGKRKQFAPELIVALSKILEIDIGYLLTGEESTASHAWSEEAEIIASIVDRMQPQTRQMMVENAQSALQCEQKIRENLEAELLDAPRHQAISQHKRKLPHYRTNFMRKSATVSDRSALTTLPRTRCRT